MATCGHQKEIPVCKDQCQRAHKESIGKNKRKNKKPVETFTIYSFTIFEIIHIFTQLISFGGTLLEKSSKLQFINNE